MSKHIPISRMTASSLNKSRMNKVRKSSPSTRKCGACHGDRYCMFCNNRDSFK